MRKHFSLLFVLAVLLIGAAAIAADLYSNTLAVRGISTATVSNNDNTDSQIIDGRGYSSVLYIITVSTVADSDATFTPSILHGDNSALSDAATVTAANLRGTATAFGIADNNTVHMLEYTGAKRYSRLRITPASNTGAATFSATAVKGFPQYRPVVR